MSSVPANGLPPRYRFVSELARGAMGRVFIVHDELLQRDVAVKEVQSDSANARRRFEREALLTARLEHPGIVAVHELGRRESGEPFLVLRRVRGQPLSAAMDKARTLEARLALLAPFISAVDAVAYAHGQGVVHRDLKPDNVLLGEFGDTVVIDWGLAKDLRKPPSASDEVAPSAKDFEVPPPAESPTQGLTHAGAVLGTPLYMSPEQARGEEVDARCDVYCLGAMLYHLLSGAPPYSGTTGAAVVFAVRKGPPQKLSERVPEIAPELATIVERAMARDREQRYPTAGALSEDLKSFLTGRLVRSHSYSLRQLLARFAKRNAAALVVAAAALVLVVGGSIFSVRRIVRERDRANREAEAARRVSDFLTSMFRSNDPQRARGATITAREVLDRGARQIEGELSGEPAMQARLMGVMGEVYASLGLHQQAQPLFERALEEQRKDPDAKLDALRTRAGLGQTQHLAGHYDQAAATLAEVLQAQQKALGPDDPETLRTEAEWAANEYDRGHFQVARDELRRVLAVHTRTLGPEHLETLKAMNALANVLARLGELDEAEKLQQSALAIAKRKLGDTHPTTFAILGALAGTYGHEHKFAQAAALANDSLAVARRVLGPDHPETLSSWTLYAQMLALSGKRAAAEAPARECFERHRAVLGEDHPETLDAEYTLALTMRRPGGNLAECERLHRDVLARRMRTLGPETPDVLASYSALAYTLADEERYADAASAMASLLDLQKKLLGPKNGAIAITAHDLASLSMSVGQRDRALQLLTEAVEIGLPPKAAQNLAADPDWKPLLDDPRFQALVATAKAKATAQK